MEVRKLGVHSRARFLATALLLAVVVAVGVSILQPPPAIGLSCSGAHQTTLDRVTISPAAGSTSTLFTFGIRYRDTANCIPRAVSLSMPDVGTFAMIQGGGTTFSGGVSYSVTLNVPAGSWPYRFAATSGTGRGDRTVTLNVAKPVEVAAEPAPAEPPAPPAPGDQPPPTDAVPTDSPAPRATPNPRDGRLPPGRNVSSGFDFQIPAIFAGPVGGVVGPWMALTGIGIAIFWVLLRRRPDSPMGMRAAVSPGTMRLPGSAREEAAIPRWLRPSLQAARAAGWGVPPPRSAVRFLGPAAPGVVRREIGYRLVRVADGPDDLRSDEVGRFDRGDQVEVLESKSAFVRVRGADGLEGWVHQAAIVSILD